MSEFTIHTIESAPAEVKEVLETVQKDNGGYIPNLIGLFGQCANGLGNISDGWSYQSP